MKLNKNAIVGARNENLLDALLLGIVRLEREVGLSVFLDLELGLSVFLD